MHSEANTWALVLAAGEGSRLRSLTTAPSGATIPKQFCSLFEGPSLLYEALARARAVASDSCTCAVVAEQHRTWWEGPLWSLPADNVIAQPENRGTGNGILLPLLHIVERDPNAQVVLLPSDHYVRREAVLAASLRKAIEQLRWRFDETLLLGLEPEEPDPELGYIVPGRNDGRGALQVEQFVEKPTPEQARRLMGRGALWNAFIVVANAQALLALFRRRCPEIVNEMRAAIRSDLRGTTDGSTTAELYSRLPVIDFSRDIVPGQEAHLSVLPVPPCGWSDLGTPKRVAEALSRVPMPRVAADSRASWGALSLAAQHARLSGNGEPFAARMARSSGRPDHG